MKGVITIRVLKILIIVMVPGLITLPICAQTITAYKLEIFMKTKNTSGATVTFKTTCQSSHVWDPNGYITTQSKFTNPIDLVIVGDYSGTEKGWDANDDENNNPDLGRAELNGSNMSYIISVANKNATLKVDCYGNTFNGDVYIMYDYSADKFYNDGTANERTTINLFDDPEYLQPTAPNNFVCTNPNQSGQNPHFTWQVPSHPNSGVGFKYKIYSQSL